MPIMTTYTMNDANVISSVEWIDHDGQRVVVKLSEADPQMYTYKSWLHGDEDFVESNDLSSLADCILQAHINLAIIPPQSFDPIPCENNH